MDNKELSELKELIKIRKQIASGELKVAQHNIDAYRKKKKYTTYYRIAKW